MNKKERYEEKPRKMNEEERTEPKMEKPKQQIRRLTLSMPEGSYRCILSEATDAGLTVPAYICTKLAESEEPKCVFKPCNEKTETSSLSSDMSRDDVGELVDQERRPPIVTEVEKSKKEPYRT